MLQATLSGNVGADAELTYTPDGKPMLRFNVASNFRERDQSGNWQDKTEWCRVTLLGQRAESLAQYIVKGTRVVCVGSLKARPWTTQDGTIRAGLELLASEIDFSTPRDGQERPAGQARTARPAAVDDRDAPF
jgi:single-strand DNA-binding protein